MNSLEALFRGDYDNYWELVNELGQEPVPDCCGEGQDIRSSSLVDVIKFEKVKRETGETMDSSLTKSPQKRLTSMEGLLGLLRIRIKRGVNLAVQGIPSSGDPYVVIKMGKQKLKTCVIRNVVNPEWNEDLTLFVVNPNLPIKLTVYDRDTFAMDDKMGEAEIPIKDFLRALKMNLDKYRSGTTFTRVLPSTTNCLAEESAVTWKDGYVVQEMCLRLKNDIERGEVELELNWIELPKGF
ncbi:hypothetical protein LguiA_026196 [Lonicera macranthoides]